MTNPNISPMFESLRKTAQMVVDVLKPQIEQLTKGISESMSQFAKLIRETMEEHDLNVKTGWWYVKYIVDDLPAEQTRTALQNESITKAFTKLIVRECNRNNYAKIHAMRERWLAYDWLKPRRKKILADIIDAHLDKKYTLSIPVAMAQISFLHEAIFPEKKEDRVPYTDKETIKSAQQANFAKHFDKNSYGRVPASVYFQLYPVYHYFKNVLYASPKLREFQKTHDPEMFKLSDPNNRGEILHGIKTNYSSEARSLKQLLLIDTILHNINKLPHSKKLL